MQIESLIKKNNYVVIHFDDGSNCKIFYDVVVKLGLRRQDKLSTAEYDNLLHENELFRAKKSSISFLQRRKHSQKEIKDKLLQKGFSFKIINDTIEFLHSKNLINDKLFAQEYTKLKYFEKNIGLLKIKHDLLKRGIKREYIEDVIQNYSDEAVSIKNIELLLSKKLKLMRTEKLSEIQIKQRLHRFLAGKGYRNELIFSYFDTIDFSKF